jgi:hypothetical protein
MLSSRSGATLVMAAAAAVALLAVGAGQAQAQVGITWFNTAGSLSAGHPALWQPSGLSAFMAHQNQFVAPQGRPLSPAPAYVGMAPLWQPSGLSAYLAGRNEYAFPQVQPQQPALFRANGLSLFLAARAAQGR